MRNRKIAGLLLVLVLVTMAWLSPGCRGANSVQKGKTVFDQHCARCHSVTAEGPVKAGPNLRLLFNVEVYRRYLTNGKQVTVQNVQVLISTGYGEMSGSALEPDEMKALIDYLMEKSQ